MSSADVNGRRLRLVEQVLRLPEDRLAEVELVLSSVPTRDRAPQQMSAERDWPHAPQHRISEAGTYMVTAGTYQKEHFFRGDDRLDYLEANLLRLAKEAGWRLEAWAVFSNHYHFVGHADLDSELPPDWIAELHRDTAAHVNELDRSPGRKVWHSYWDTQLTFERSYFARLNYVHHNAVKHGLVRVANQYRWCSAAWFERTATRAQVRTIYSFKTDQVKILDDFDPL